MSSHLTAMTHNLTWTRSGTVWAMWRLEPLAYGYRTLDAKTEVRALHTGLLQALRGEAVLLGYCASTDPAAVVERMITDVDLDQRPEWAAECIATLDFLEQIDIGRRAYWLAVPLANTGSKAWAEPLRSASANIKDALAMPRTGPSPRQVAARLEQAELIRKAIPGKFKPRPATVAEMVWLHVHAQQRGLHLDLSVPNHDNSDPTTLMLSSPAAIPGVHLDPCGQTDTDKKNLSPADILKRRYLKVTGIETGQPSYQVMLAVADVPSGGISFPGGEWLGRLDESGLPVDWALRMNIRSREDVTTRNRRANANLNDQLDQRSEENRAGGAGSQLITAASALAEYQAILDSDEFEVEVEHTTILAIGASTPDEAVDTARELTKFYARSQFKLITDPSAQEALWHAMLPGQPTPRAARELSQITTAHHLAAAVPIVTAELGDDRGSLLALEISGGRPHPVLCDLAGAGTRMDVAMAVGVVGELGSGKSVTLKKLAIDTVDRGASLVAIDRTKTGEWTTAVRPIPGSVIVDLSENAQHSVDPLRIFGAAGGRMAQSFLTTLLNIDSTDVEGVLLSDVLEADYLRRHDIASLGALIDHLLAGCELAGAADLGRKMNVFARKDFGRAVFDQALPALDLDAPALVFWTAVLELPDRDELNNPMRFKQMRLERKLGRAIYTLIAAIAKQRCFVDTSRLGVFIVDEAHSVTSSPEGLAELKEFIRDGRKHQAALILGSHDPEADFGDEVLRGLIAFRILMRHRDRTLAARGLRWLLGEPTDAQIDDELIDLISTDTSPVRADAGVPLERRGECLIRDFQGRIGRAKILPPATTERAQAVLTTPRGATS